MMSTYELVVLNGPLSGQSTTLSQKKPTLIGRSGRGFQLVDSLVSLAHAEVAWLGDRYVIEDLGSATGTFVDDVRVTDKSLPLKEGSKIRVGDTEIGVRVRKQGNVLKVVGFTATALAVLLGFYQALQQVRIAYEPTLHWFEPVHQAPGVASRTIPVPQAFGRKYGVRASDLKIRDVTDVDRDGIDELWLSWRREGRIVEFGDGGAWQERSVLPPGCRRRGNSARSGLPAECFLPEDVLQTRRPAVCDVGAASGGFPELVCHGATYQFTEGRGYAIAAHDAPVVWAQPVDEGGDDDDEAREEDVVEGPRVVAGAPVPYRATVLSEERLAGFLARRGVFEPVHYLVCEEALPGVAAQVRTASGHVLPLPVGCISDALVSGPHGAPILAGLRPLMIAFTANGYEALLNDVEDFLVGNDSGFFHTRDARVALASIRTAPKSRVGTWFVGFDAVEGIQQAVADDAPLPPGARLHQSELAEPPAPRATVVDLLEPGAKSWRVGECGTVTAERTPGWECVRTRGCSASTTFAALRLQGCGGSGRTVAIPWAAGRTRFEDGAIQGEVAVSAAELTGAVHMLRARVATRVVAGDDAVADSEPESD